jgi:lipoprotein-releasing system permease protein
VLFRFAWRYFRSKKNIQAVTIIARVAIGGIAVGTAALVIILSIFNGFEGLVKDLYSSFYPDIRITSKSKNMMMIDSVLKSKIAGTKGVQSVSYVIESNAHIMYGEARTNAVIKGVDQAFYSVSGVPESITSGSFKTGAADQPYIVLGAGLEYQLGLQSDRSLEPLTVYLPKKGSTQINPMEAVSVANMYPTGAFAIQQEFDNRYVFTNIDIVRQMLGTKENMYSSAELRISNNISEDMIIKDLSVLLGSDFNVEDRYRQNRSLFAVMQVEKWIIYAILSLILLLASFTMIGALTMLVLEKQQDIQILKAMGMTDGKILRLFLLEGILLAFTGGILGTIFALLFCYLQVTYKLIPLEGSFVIDYYPVKVVIPDILLVFATLIFIALAAAWVPSYKAARKKTELKAQ